MKREAVKKVMIFDQGNEVADQLLCKALELFGDCAFAATGGVEAEVEILIVRVYKNHELATEILEEVVHREKPEILLIGATALGEEVAPALGIRLGTGVAAHCVDIAENDEGRLTYMVPAFGGKVIGEIFIPDAEPGVPAIATVKPGMFSDSGIGGGTGDSIGSGIGGLADRAGCTIRIIDGDRQTIDNAEAGAAAAYRKGTFQMTGVVKREQTAKDISKAELVLCGGFGIGSEEYWKKLELLADRLGGAVGCTRPVLDAGWGSDEYSMIGTSGRTVKPKIYVGFGISGATHHLCGIKDAGIIISINNDKDADVFAASDYRGVFDARAVIDALLE